MAACPRLTELTIVSHYQYGVQHGEMGFLLDPAGGARSAISELVVACKALPDFNTLQIVRSIIVPSPLICRCGWGGCGSRMDSSEQSEQMLGKQTKDIKDWAIECLRKPEAGYREGAERRSTLRIFKFSPGRPCHSSPKVEECEV